MGYVRDHWLGRQALPWSFWVNFALPCILIHAIEPLVRPSPVERLLPLVLLALLYVVVCYAIIYPWQIVGLLRACDRHVEEKGDLVAVTLAQGAMIVSLIAGIGSATTTLQSAFWTEPAVEAGLGRPPPRYRLDVIEGGSLVRIDGLFDPGVTRELRTMLAERPAIQGIVLKSNGGRVFEGRGIAKLIFDHELETHVDDFCRSACTIAYIAGSERSLREEARLGFHSYDIEAVNNPFIDIAAEQEKDRAFFLGRGVSADFMTRAFATPHEEIWYPDTNTLLAANVVHRIIRDQRE